jgi:hypothetical protein
VALDTYFRGNSEEEAFCRQLGAGGNHLAAATASGRALGKDRGLRLRQQELDPVLDEYRGLPKSERQPALVLGVGATPSRRPVPQPPDDGLILRGYCTYLRRDEAGRIGRSTEFYYKENPDRWAAETQSDLIWLTADEWRSLLPEDPRAGQQIAVGAAIQRRFFATLAIDYMEGSVNSLSPRDTAMTLTVQQVADDRLALRLDGSGRMGVDFEEHERTAPRSRGCQIRLLGFLLFDRNQNRFEQFDVVGIGEAWGNKMDYVQREVRLESYPWLYGIACELVRDRGPCDLIPPYNLLHYNSAGPYFADD